MLTESSVIRRAVLLACLSAGATAAGAQLRAEPSMWGADRDGVKLRSNEVVDLRTVAPQPIDPYAYKRGLFASIGLYEYRPAGAAPGQYTRPHYAFGLQSEVMRDAVSLTGLDAESCVAPMVRLRARQTTITGATGFSVGLLARCTFY